MSSLRNAIAVMGLVLALVTASVAAVRADSLTGSDLDQLCSGPDQHSDRDALCDTYVHGLVDGLNIGATLQSLHISYCPPKGLSVSEVRKIVSSYLRDHQTELGTDAATLAARAIIAVFPCPKSSK